MPATLIVVKNFEVSARLNAKTEGLSNLSVVVLPNAFVPQPKEIEESGLAGYILDKAIETLASRSQRSIEPPALPEMPGDMLTFQGADYPQAAATMERYFLERCWSDGLPLVPPTRRAVDAMLEGTDLDGEHVLGAVEPGRRTATVEKIAINAVMAGCLPQYMPVILAAFEALIDPRFDLRGVQSTAGMVSPVFIVSGPGLIQQLNINDSYSTIGPGWKANSTIARALKLILTNLGGAWPGRTDMKSFGSPFKFGMLLAESDSIYGSAWEPLRVAEGFAASQPTVSVMPAVSWSPDFITADRVHIEKLVEVIVEQARAKYDRKAYFWGKDNLILISPSMFRAITHAGLTRADFQKLLFERIEVPAHEFYDGKAPYGEAPGGVQIPAHVVQACIDNANATVPLFARPESLKIVAAGGKGPAMVAYISTWGAGPAYFVTKPINTPKNWTDLLSKYAGWDTPIVS